MSKSEILIKYAELLEAYPILKQRKPLAIGVADEVLKIVGDVAVSKAIMSTHANNPKYLESLSTGKVRYNLDGTEAGEVTDDHRANALQRLIDDKARIVKKKAAQKAHEILQIQHKIAKEQKLIAAAEKVAAKAATAKKLAEQAAQNAAAKAVPMKKSINISAAKTGAAKPATPAVTVVVKKRRTF